MTSDFAKEFIEQSLHRIDLNTQRVIKCFQELDDNEIWKIPNDNSNSPANLILHLCGNIRQYIISALGGAKDVRERDKEFSTKNAYSKSSLLDELTGTISEASEIIKSLDENELMKVYPVQGTYLSGAGIIIHVTEHYSYHTGQIAFWTKQVKNMDLGFYANIDLNSRNGQQ